MINYSCGHKNKGLMVTSSSPLAISAYLSWKESDSKECFQCWKLAKRGHSGKKVIK